MSIFNRDYKEKGGAILEYLLVTAFTLITGVATLNYVNKIIKSKMEKLSEQVHIEQNTQEDSDDLEEFFN